MPTIEELRFLQALPLELKVMRTKQRIREWVDHFGVDGVYVSFSGGKDSTVLLHIVREMYPEAEAVFADTGLEYPEIREFVKGFENVTWVRPKMNFAEVIKKYGYPFISKDIARALREYKNYILYGGNYTVGCKKLEGKVSKFGSEKYDYSSYLPIAQLPIKFGEICCNIMKKVPMNKIKKIPFVATMAEESMQRLYSWLSTGCNAFNSKKQISKPMSLWTEQDVLEYITTYNLSIASVYGDICETDKHGNLVIDGCGIKLTCSGCQRTGCVFCGFGAHLDTQKGGVSRFVRLKQTHPKLYAYCMNGGEFIDGIWQPNKQGLGMRYVIDELNKLYSKTLKNGKVKKFIEY